MNFDTFFAGQSAELVPPDVREGEIAVREIMHSSVINHLTGLKHFLQHSDELTNHRALQTSWTGYVTSQRSAIIYSVYGYSLTFMTASPVRFHNSCKLLSSLSFVKI